MIAPALVLDMSRAMVAGQLITVLERQNKALPALPPAQPFGVIADNEVDLIRVFAHSTDQSHISGQITNALESSNKVQGNEALGIHALAEVDVLAQVLNGKVVLNLSPQDRDEHVIPVGGLEGHSRHRRHRVVIGAELSLNRRNTRRAIGERHAMEISVAIATSPSTSLWWHETLTMVSLSSGRAVRSLSSGSGAASGRKS